MLDGVRTGDVLQMTHWHHTDVADGKRFQIDYKVPQRGMAALFLYLGSRYVRGAPFETVDLEAEMTKIGWHRGTDDEIAATAAANHQRNLLAQALGKLLVAIGMTRPDAPLTGPELLLAAETAIESMQPPPKEEFDGFNG